LRTDCTTQGLAYCKENPYIADDIREPVVITSKITSKAQTTIPQPVRAALRVGEGDELAYTIQGDHVILTKAKRDPIDDPFATFHEWSSEADRRAYGDL
jgi:antitoxin PrlF